MPTELIVAHSAYHWTEFIEGLLTVFFTGLAAWIPTKQYLDKKRESKKEAERSAMRKQLEDEQRAKIKYLDIQTFEMYDKRNTQEHESLTREVRASNDQLSRVVQTSAIESSNAAAKVEKLSDEIRETLQVFKMGIDQSLGEVHEKTNGAIKDVATFDGRLKALEKRAG